MKKNYLYLAALAMFTAACSNEDEFAQEGIKPSPEVKMITETIKASNGDNTPATRAAIDANADFTWSEGDQIAVHVSDGKYYTTSGLAAGGGEYADFTVSYPEGARDAFAVYPASIVTANAANYGQSGHTLDVTLPASYTLAQVSGDKTPCPMIATNTPGGSWEFFQLCGMLRLTLDGIPAGASYLQVDFDGKQVSGDFSIASPNPGSSTISTSAASNAGDKIKISALEGATSAVINLPLPTGDYSNIRVSAVTNSNVTVKEWDFNYEAQRAKGKRIKTTMPDTPSITFKQGTAITTSSSSAVDLESIIGFQFKVGKNTLSNLRFVRIFSEGNLLQTTYVEGKNTSTFGPITEARSNDETAPLPQTIYLGMRFNETASPIVVQAIDADGKVYSGTTTAPVSFKNGFFYKTVSVLVKLYTFTVSAGKVYFSPGDLGVNGDVYSFTDPFATWGWGDINSTTKRVWFNYNEIASGCKICGINWRNFNSLTTSTTTTQPQEWDKIIGRTNMKEGVQAYYRVTVSGHANCLLLPPDETQATDIGNDITSGIVTDYVKYLGKGFVLLISTGRAISYSTNFSWGMATEGWYWALWKNMSQNRTYFYWTVESDNTPTVSWNGNQIRMRARLVHDVN